MSRAHTSQVKLVVKTIDIENVSHLSINNCIDTNEEITTLIEQASKRFCSLNRKQYCQIIILISRYMWDL